MKKTLQFLLTLCCFTALCHTATATHLMGGNMTYTYLGQSGLNFNYAVTLKIYRLCDSGSSQLPNNLNLGAYEEDTLFPSADKNLVASFNLPLISQQFIVPPSSNPSCGFATNVCVEEGVYQTTISVPASSGGYHLIADRCCRNNTIQNIDNPNNAGQAYYAFIPPTNIVNNAPTFAVAPVPFMCVNDTVSILNAASDIDGDLLTYQFVVPYNGISSGGNPQPNPPNTYTWPIPAVNYAANYSLSQPFGSGGYAVIDTTTGLASYSSPMQGYFVVAVEIKEFRNGVLIGITRRDIQLIVIVCPINPAPLLSSSAGSGQTVYTILEGQNICFNTTFNDSNGDSLFLNHTGDVFISALTNPTATLIDVQGDSTITSQFCWTTGCNQGRSSPYQFSVIVNDNGCPAKTTNIVYTINVVNTPKPASINGVDTLCANTLTGNTYSVPLAAGYTFDWIITNGTQVTGTNTHIISVDFTAPGNATVSAVTLNPYGCPSDTITKNIFIKTLPAAVAGSDVSFCSGASASIGTSSTSGITYSWSPSTGLNNPNISNPTVTLTNGTSNPVTTQYIVSTSVSGCSNKDTIDVTVGAIPVANAGSNSSTCSNSGVQLGSIPTAGYTYTWTPASGLSNSAIANPQLILSNVSLVPDTFYYSLIVQNGALCRDSDTVRIVVAPVPVANAGTNAILCSGQSASIGSPAISGYTYSWLPATSLSSSTVSDPLANPINSTSVVDTFNYALITTWFGCKDTDTVAVIVNPIPTANAGPNTLLCSGNTVTLGTLPTTGYTYAWNPSSGLSNGSIANPSLSLINVTSVPDTLQYIVTTTLSGCTDADTVQIISSPLPTATAGNDVIFCSGQSVAIGTPPVSGYGYSWSPNTGINSPLTANPNLLLTNLTSLVDTVSITLTVSQFGCTDRDTINAFIKPLPVSQAGTNQSLCSGDTATIGVAATSGYTYQWNPVTQLNSGVISNPSLTVNNSGSGIDTLQYIVTTTLNGCISSDTTSLFINPLPNVQASSSPTAICSGSTATLTGSGASTYSWALASAPSIGIGTGGTLSVTPTLTTSYIVTGTNAATCVNTSLVTVTVNQLPAITIASANDTICNGDTLQLNANGASNYTWYAIGSPAAIGTGNTIQVSPLSNTSYLLVGIDGNLCQEDDTLAIIVSPAATISNITGTVSLCPGVTGVSYWVNNGLNTSTYQWTITNGTITIGQGTDSALVDWPVAGSGSVSIVETTDEGCKSDPVVLPVIINPILTPMAASGPQLLCANVAQGLVYTTLQTPGSSYNWFALGGNVFGNPDTTGSITIDWTVTGPATVYVWYEETSNTVSNNCFGVSDTFAVTINPIPVTSAIAGVNAICINDTASYSVNNTSGNTYQWAVQNGTIVNGNGTNAINVMWADTGLFTITVNETNNFNCEGNVVFQNVYVNPLPVANAGSDISICTGDTAQLLATGGINYSWSPATNLDNTGINNPLVNPTSNITYTVLVTDVNGCKKSDDIDVDVNALPIVDAGITTAICLNDTANLLATGGINYAWSPSFGLNDSTIANPDANPTATTLYTVLVTDANNCKASDTITIIVNPLPTAVADSVDPICEGTSVLLNASGAGNGGSYNWSPITGLVNANTSTPSATPPLGIIVYTVIVTDANGCKDETDIALEVNTKPIANFEIDSILGAQATCKGVLVQFTNNSTDAINYHWNFGDNATSTETNPIHLYNFSQGGLIELIAINGDCSDTIYQNNPVLSLAEYVSAAPNVFTPNDDKKNDCFRLGTEGSFDDCSEMKIFNRWGKLVFETDGTYKCWNGKNKSTGEDEPQGVYFYILRVDQFQVKGSLQLIR